MHFIKIYKTGTERIWHLKKKKIGRDQLIERELLRMKLSAKHLHEIVREVISSLFVTLNPLVP